MSSNHSRTWRAACEAAESANSVVEHALSRSRFIQRSVRENEIGEMVAYFRHLDIRFADPYAAADRICRRVRAMMVHSD